MKQIKLKRDLPAHWVRTGSTCLPIDSFVAICIQGGVLCSMSSYVLHYPQWNNEYSLLLLAQLVLDCRIYLMVLFLILSTVLHFPPWPAPWLAHHYVVALHNGTEDRELAFLCLVQWVSPRSNIWQHCAGNVSSKEILKIRLDHLWMTLWRC